MNNTKHDVPPELAEEFDRIMDERRALEVLQASVFQEVLRRGLAVEGRRRAWWDRVCRELGVGVDERWEYDRAARVIKTTDDAPTTDDTPTQIM